MKKLLLGLAFIAVANADTVKDDEQDARIAILEDEVLGRLAYERETQKNEKKRMARERMDETVRPSAVEEFAERSDLQPLRTETKRDLLEDDKTLPAAVEPKKVDEVKADVAGPKLTEFQSLVKAYADAGKADREPVLVKVKDAFKQRPMASCNEFVAFVASGNHINQEKFGTITSLFDLSPQLNTLGNRKLLKGITSKIDMPYYVGKTRMTEKRLLTAAEICENVK